MTYCSRVESWRGCHSPVLEDCPGHREDLHLRAVAETGAPRTMCATHLSSVLRDTEPRSTVKVRSLDLQHNAASTFGVR